MTDAHLCFSQPLPDFKGCTESSVGKRPHHQTSQWINTQRLLIKSDKNFWKADELQIFPKDSPNTFWSPPQTMQCLLRLLFFFFSPWTWLTFTYFPTQRAVELPSGPNVEPEKCFSRRKFSVWDQAQGRQNNVPVTWKINLMPYVFHDTVPLNICFVSNWGNLKKFHLQMKHLQTSRKEPSSSHLWFQIFTTPKVYNADLLCQWIIKGKKKQPEIKLRE